jgi:catechol 2,3-dioxygenase-like lactoylglutathione lyase family enzyme
MTARLNHVSISAPELEKSARWYEELFGLERLPTPNFGYPVLWLRAGDLQVHLFQRPVEPPSNHHFALTVDDFERVYEKAQALGALDARTMGGALRKLPDGSVQLYLRDPAGNLVEVDHPRVRGFEDLPRLEDAFPQNDENRRATLFLR